MHSRRFAFALLACVSVAVVASAQSSVVIKMNPLKGEPGTQVYLTGDFDPNGAFTLDGVPAKVIVSGTSTRLVVPDNATSGLIQTTSWGKNFSTSSAFVVGPRFTAATPSSAAPGDTLSVDGYNFENVTSVSFSTKTMTAVTAGFVLGTRRTISVTVPAAPAGAELSGDFTIRTAAGSTSGFVTVVAIAAPAPPVVAAPPAGPPILESVTPLTGAPGSTVSIKGKNLQRTQWVTFGREPAPSIKIVSPTEVQAVVPTSGTATGYVALGGPDGKVRGPAYKADPYVTGYSVQQVARGGSFVIRGFNFNAPTAVTLGSLKLSIAKHTRSLLMSAPNPEVPCTILVKVPAAAATGVVTVFQGTASGSGPSLVVTD